MVTKENLGKLIKFFREKKGLSVKALATKVPRSQSGLTEIENGKRFPKLQLLIDICNELDINIAEVFYYLDRVEEIDLQHLDQGLQSNNRKDKKDEKIEALKREVNRLKVEIYDIQNKDKIKK